MADADDRCPYLVPVMNDRLWMYPMSAYCRRPEAHVKVPAAETFLGMCVSPSHVRCAGYLASAGRTESPGA